MQPGETMLQPVIGCQVASVHSMCEESAMRYVPVSSSEGAATSSRYQPSFASESGSHSMASAHELQRPEGESMSSSTQAQPPGQARRSVQPQPRQVRKGLVMM